VNLYEPCEQLLPRLRLRLAGSGGDVEHRPSAAEAAAAAGADEEDGDECDDEAAWRGRCDERGWDERGVRPSPVLPAPLHINTHTHTQPTVTHTVMHAHLALSSPFTLFNSAFRVQSFDAVGWAAGRASGL